jgi:hypothetical protein
LQNRIDFHMARYRGAHEDAGEAWISVDGKKLFGVSDLNYRNAEHAERSKDQPSAPEDSGWQYFGDAEHYQEIANTLHAREIHTVGELLHAMHVYLDLPVQDALKSENPFLRALAIMDRRTGKRTLDKLQISAQDHSLVHALYTLRTGKSSGEQAKG